MTPEQLRIKIYQMKHAAMAEGRSNPRLAVYISYEMWDELCNCRSILNHLPQSRTSSEISFDGHRVHLVADDSHGCKIYEDRLMLEEARPGGQVRTFFAKED